MREIYKDDEIEIIIEDGIMYITTLIEIVDYHAVDKGIKERIKLANGREYPLLSDIRKVKDGTREARERMAKRDAAEGVIAVAILVNSPAQKVIYGFFNLIYKAPATAKVFTDMEKALKWLEKYKQKY